MDKSPESYTPEELLRVAKNTRIPVDVRKRAALMALIEALEGKDRLCPGMERSCIHGPRGCPSACMRDNIYPERAATETERALLQQVKDGAGVAIQNPTSAGEDPVRMEADKWFKKLNDPSNATYKIAHAHHDESAVTREDKSRVPVYRGWIKVDDGTDSPWHTDCQEWVKLADVVKRMESFGWTDAAHEVRSMGITASKNGVSDGGANPHG